MTIWEVILAAGGIAGAITAILKLLDRPTRRAKEAASKREAEFIDKLTSTMEARLQPKFDALSERIDKLTKNQQELIREKIRDIYYHNKQIRVLSSHQKIVIDKLYHDYKEMGGNSYIDELYQKMSCWDIVDDANDD